MRVGWMVILLSAVACTGGAPEPVGEAREEERDVAERTDDWQKEYESLQSREEEAEAAAGEAAGTQEERPGVLGDPKVSPMGRARIERDMDLIRVSGTVVNRGSVEALGSLHVELYDPGAKGDEGVLGQQELPMSLGAGHERQWTATFWAGDSSDGRLAARVKWKPV